MDPSTRLFWWLVQRLLLGLLLAGVLFGALGWWTWRQDAADFATRRQARLNGITAEISRLQAAQADTEARAAATRVEIAARKSRAAQAERVVRELEDLNGGLSRLTTSSEQRAENDERLARMRQMQSDSLKKAVELEQAAVRLQWEKDGIEIALERQQRELAATQADRSPAWHCARVVWSRHGTWVLLVSALAAIVPLFLRRSLRS
ncbi:MAG TPA: hypothetical protein VL200_01285 [Lacunisphaera sp.]|nr:hypothetical protein [Lacunisphaera sp.]